MKPYPFIALSVILSITLLSGCNKDNNDTPKDYTSSVSNKTWSGIIVYTGDSIQYYTVHFKEDKTLLWSQLAGDYPGNWGLVGNQLTLTFTGSNAVIKATITDDDHFANIVVENTAAYKVNSGIRIENPNMTLESTIWNGGGFFAVAQYPYQMSFLPGSKVQMKINNVVHPLYTYTRTDSGAAIRFTSTGSTKIFGVIMSATEIKGSAAASSNPWHTIKQ